MGLAGVEHGRLLGDWLRVELVELVDDGRGLLLDRGLEHIGRVATVVGAGGDRWVEDVLGSAEGGTTGLGGS